MVDFEQPERTFPEVGLYGSSEKESINLGSELRIGECMRIVKVTTRIVFGWLWDGCKTSALECPKSMLQDKLMLRLMLGSRNRNHVVGGLCNR